MTNPDQPTLEERVEMLEKRVRRVQWTQQIDWDVAMHSGTVVIIALLIFALALTKC